MKKFLKKQREFIAVALFLLALGMSTYFVVVPLLKKITLTRDEIEENKIKQEIKKQRLEELPKIAQRYTEVSSQQEKFDILLEKQQAVVLIERLESLAQDTNNKIQIVVVPSDTEPKKATSKTAPKVVSLADALPKQEYLKLKITLAGDYGGAFKFIHGLESLDYYADTIEISMGNITGNDQATSSASGGPDASSPFGAQVARNPELVVSDSGHLETVLTVVFYSKD